MPDTRVNRIPRVYIPGSMTSRGGVLSRGLAALALAAAALGVAASGAAGDGAPVAQAIEDPRRVMDGFYRGLARVKRRERGAIVRISHFGDSLVADDHMGLRTRERLQGGFGDAGPGFVYLGSPHPYWRRRGIRHESQGWSTRTIVSSTVSDRLYGLGGATFLASGGGPSATFATAKKGTLGTRVSRFELYYLEQPRGGKLEVHVDGRLVETVDTAADVVRSAWKRVDVPDGEHAFVVKVAAGKVRAFGAVLERDEPGVVYDQLGMIGGSVRALSQIEASHWREQLAHRAPDLVIVLFGANEAEWTANTTRALERYREGFEALLAAVRKARPDVACLVMGQLDAAEVEDGRLVSRAVIPGLVEAQRQAAFATGCAFWDTYALMGGKGAAAKWRRKGLLAGDLMHLTSKGSTVVADALVDALLQGFEASQRR